MTKTAQLSDPPITERHVLEIGQAGDEIDWQLSDPVRLARPIQQMTKIDRIDDKGNIREHLTRDGSHTICGIEIGQRQAPYGNATCKRCEKIAARCQIAPLAASGK